MSIYKLPETKINKKEDPKNVWSLLLLLVAFIASVFVGLNLGATLLLPPQEVISNNLQDNKTLVEQGVNIIDDEYSLQTEQERIVTNAVEESYPSVVSVIIKKTSGEIYEEYLKGNPFDDFFNDLLPHSMPNIKAPKDKDVLKQVGAGTGFFVSTNGLIVTNKHVIEDETAVYSVLTNEGEEYDVELLSKNPVQDIAILKIKNAEGKNFKPLKLGNSSKLRLGQSAIAIGNALGEFQNSVSVGVISGLERNVVAQGSGALETLEDIIQTDAAINKGNSGGPLLNLRGEVIGINTAVSMAGENIGFAIPINKVKRDLKQVLNQGKISYPFIGIRYIIIDKDLAEKEKFSVDYGALIVEAEEGGEASIVSNSPADKAGLKEKDILLEFDGEKVSKKNSLTKIVQKYFPGDKAILKVLRDGEEIMIDIVLDDWNNF